jgi:hypothetical protein
MPKRFTLVEAERLIPQVDALLRQAIPLKAQFAEAERAWTSILERVSTRGGVVLDRDQSIEVRTRREQLATQLKSVLEGIQEIGCLVKDIDIGLVDFPTLFRGTEVYLCWKLGEPSIAHWHGVNEGFRGRKPIDQDFRENHQGDLPQ